jgi:hypothetical protein
VGGKPGDVKLAEDSVRLSFGEIVNDLFLAGGDNER